MIEEKTLSSLFVNYEGDETNVATHIQENLKDMIDLVENGDILLDNEAYKVYEDAVNKSKEDSDKTYFF